MKLLKFILPVTAMLMVFAVVESTAQICVYDKTHEYKLEDAIKYKGDEFEFIKFCCEELGKCTDAYAAYDHYYLTHVAAMYKRDAVLKYLVEERHIPKDSYPVFVDPGDKVEYRTQVMMSSARGDYASAKFLVENGVNITRKDRDQKSAYDYALASGNQKLVDYMKPLWRKAMGYAQARVEQNKKDLIKVLTLNDIEKELKNFKRDIKFNGFFG